MAEYLVIQLIPEVSPEQISLIQEATALNRLVTEVRKASSDDKMVIRAQQSETVGFIKYDPDQTDKPGRPYWEVQKSWRRARDFDTIKEFAEAAGLPHSTAIHLQDNFNAVKNPKPRTIEKPTP